MRAGRGCGCSTAELGARRRRCSGGISKPGTKARTAPSSTSSQFLFAESRTRPPEASASSNRSAGGVLDPARVEQGRPEVGPRGGRGCQLQRPSVGGHGALEVARAALASGAEWLYIADVNNQRLVKWKLK